jgi:hypothetical protein
LKPELFEPEDYADPQSVLGVVLCWRSLLPITLSLGIGESTSECPHLIEFVHLIRNIDNMLNWVHILQATDKEVEMLSLIS